LLILINKLTVKLLLFIIIKNFKDLK